MRLALVLAPLVILVALIAVFASSINRDPNFVPSVLINKPVPQVSLPAIDDTIATPGFTPTDLVGDVHVVNVFASWCIPCRDEHPILMELSKTGTSIIGMNQKDAPENARAFLDELGNPYTRIGADKDGRAAIEWGVYGVPETFVVNAKGIITYKHVGPLSQQSYETSLLPAITAAKTDAD